jgi:hypothetical protein
MKNKEKKELTPVQKAYRQFRINEIDYGGDSTEHNGLPECKKSQGIEGLKKNHFKRNGD